MARVAVIGLGYVGLPTAIVLSEAGLKVHGYDIDQDRVDKINKGIKVIEEHELGSRLIGALSRKNFIASTKLVSADFFIIAVPTPISADKKANLDYVWAACQEVSKKLQPGNCVIIESTVPVGTTKKVAAFLAKESSLTLGVNLFVAFSPERVLPGKTFTELVHNDRLVGGVNEYSSKIARGLYQSFVKGDIEITSSEVAEMVKLVENSSRDVEIAFANQVASMSSAAGIDAHEVIKLANKHPRVNILNPGCGVGGHCIPVDPWFLIESFPSQTNLLSAARKVNDSKPMEVLASIRKMVDQLKRDKNIEIVTLCIFGVTYKPDVDDLRNSPALIIAREIQEWKDINLIVLDPLVEIDVLQKYFSNPVKKIEHIVDYIELAVLLVSHTYFSTLKENSFVTKDVIDFCESNLVSVRKASFNT